MRKLIFIMVLFTCAVSPAQESWLYEDSNFDGKQILEAYDGGTLILANDEWAMGPSKLFKLDKTGALLWTHTFEENVETLPLCLEEDSHGNIIIAGKTLRYQSAYADGFLLKLNPCGELLWYNAMVENFIGNFIPLFLLDNNDIVIVDYNNDINNGEYTEDTTIKKYSSNGQLLWTSILIPEAESAPNRIIKCSDGGYLIEGDVWLPPYYNQDYNLSYLRASLVKTDSLGNVEWRDFYRWEQDTPDTLYGSTNSGSIVEVENDEYMAIAYKRETPNRKPDLYRINNQGEVVWHKDIGIDTEDYEIGKMSLAKDSTIILAGYIDEYLNIQKFTQQGVELDRWLCPDKTIAVRDCRWNADSTALYIMPVVKENLGNWIYLYAFMFNTDSMQVDTFSSVDNNEYDYYCPEGVVDLNFEFPELSIVEQPEVIKEQIKIAPNPARNFTYLYFDITDYNRSAKLEIYNMQGALMKSYPLQAAIGRVQEDLSSYPKGVYVVSLIVNDRLVESSKMVVE